MKSVITNNPAQCNRALAALGEVIDPEIGLNIVDLGLLYQVDFEDKKTEMFISMTLTTPFCPMGESIRTSARRALEKAFPEYAIHMELVFEPRWSQDRISEAGQEFLSR